MKISLNGLWEFKKVSDSKWMTATVPGCNYLDLMDAKIIKDPFYGENEKDVYWVAERDWKYDLCNYRWNKNTYRSTF